MGSDSEESDMEAWVDFEDMVFDWDRNHKYRAGIESAINRVKQTGRDADVIDIGSGSGLLSFYSVKAGADKVVGVEMDSVIYATSMKIAERNGLHDRVAFVNTNSTEYSGCQNMANVLVSEMVDSELIGENLIPTYRHALQNLLRNERLSVPAFANVYVEAVHSSFLRDHAQVPLMVRSNCNANLRGIEGQWSMLGADQMERVSERALVKRFDLASLDSVMPFEQFNLELRVRNDAEPVDGLLFYWELDMTGDGSCIISTEPGNSAWRNHWLPMLFPFAAPVRAIHNTLRVRATHDLVSFWFEPIDVIEQYGPSVSRRECLCDWHSILSPQTLFRWNMYQDSELARTIRNCTVGKRVVCLGSHSFLPILIDASALITSVDTDLRFCQKMSQVMQQMGNLTWKSVAGYDHIEVNNLDIVIMDMFSLPAASPMQFTYLFHELRRFQPRLQFFPDVLELKMSQVAFKDLSKRRANFAMVDEFDYTDFAQLCKPPNRTCDHHLELLPLWEYEHRILSTRTIYSTLEPNPTKRVELSVDQDCDALVFWWSAMHNNVHIPTQFGHEDMPQQFPIGTQQWVGFRSGDAPNNVVMEWDLMDWAFWYTSGSDA